MARPDPDDELDDHAAPPGTVCGVHPERTAVATCPGCRRNVCFSCWHMGIDLCHACVRKDPAAAGPSVPWEEQGRGLLSRLVGTFLAALHPARTSPSFARPLLGRPLLFFALTGPLLAALSGVIPFTHTLGFMPGWGLRLLGSPDRAAVLTDVVNAAGIGLATTAVLWLGVALPYTSLLRAYGDPGARRYGWRVLLYRGWLLTLFPGQLLATPVMLAVPEMAVERTELLFLLIALVFALVPAFLFFVALTRTARVAAGVGPIASFVVSMVALTFGGLAWSVLGELMSAAGWLPAVIE